MELKSSMSRLSRLQTRIEELGGRLIEHQTWREGGDEIEERTLAIGARGVQLNQGMRDGLSAEVKEHLDGPNPWRALTLFVKPELETMTLDESVDWIVAHHFIDDEAYLAWMIQYIEKFVGRN